MTMDSTVDPRTRMASPAFRPSNAGPAAAADYVCFGDLPPAEEDDTGATWYARGQNFLITYSQVLDGWSASRVGQPDEYVVVLPDSSTRAAVEANGETADVNGFSLIIVPPGDSTVTITGAGKVLRLLTSRAAGDQLRLATNADSYIEPHATVAPFQPWPEAPDGNKIRSYSLDVPREETRFGRIFRCSTFMVNYLYPTVGPRDTSKMSPHTHDDFEQASFAVEGDYYHHLRWPWTVNKAHWRDDDHVHCPAPSLAIIPPPVIHTSQAVGAGDNQLIDIFCPPRHDFSAQEGWVLNHDEYPGAGPDDATGTS